MKIKSNLRAGKGGDSGSGGNSGGGRGRGSDDPVYVPPVYTPPPYVPPVSRCVGI